MDLLQMIRKQHCNDIYTIDCDIEFHHYYVNDRLFLQPVYHSSEDSYDTKAVSDLENIR